MHPSRVVLPAVVGALAASTMPANAAVVPAIEAFAARWNTIENYSATAIVHEVKGSQTQDRTYKIEFKKPMSLKVDVVAGANRGAGIVWDGGDTVVGHQGGLLSFVRLKVPITDPRVLTLRGDTVRAADLGTIVGDFQNPAATQTSKPGPTIDGEPTTEVEDLFASPQSDGQTRDVLFLSDTTHLPMRRLRYVGDRLVKSENFDGVTVNTDLKGSF